MHRDNCQSQLMCAAELFELKKGDQKCFSNGQGAPFLLHSWNKMVPHMHVVRLKEAYALLFKKNEMQLYDHTTHMNEYKLLWAYVCWNTQLNDKKQRLCNIFKTINSNLSLPYEIILGIFYYYYFTDIWWYHIYICHTSSIFIWHIVTVYLKLILMWSSYGKTITLNHVILQIQLSGFILWII